MENSKTNIEALEERNNSLLRLLEEQNLINMFKRIDFLFKVLDHKEEFKAIDPKFYKNCIEELITVLDIQKEEK